MKYELENGWSTKIDKDLVFNFAQGYKHFLDTAKTEREGVLETIKMAEEKGFKPLDAFTKLQSGDKVYAVNKNKEIILAVIGTQKISEGVSIVGAHLDAPRLDLKQNPLYEDSELAFFKTHYYGGIKKYQWTAVPLAIHGVVIKENGEEVNIRIGDEDDDITFVITDLLPHLAREQMKKTASEVIEGENLNLLVGSVGLNDEDEKEKVKANVLKLLNEKYGIKEEDFLSAELEIVPAAKAKDIGFDRGLVGAYAHDDRVCAYPAIRAILELDKCEKTSICLLTDKEEIGSMGNTGAKSNFLKLILMELMDKTEGASQLNLLRCLDKSMCLSADVNAAFDPNFPAPYEKKNCGKVNYGVTVCKYTGSGGKGGSSDASAETMAEVRRIFNSNDILWHTAELGKVDAGGGGTIAQYVANLGVDTVDCGVSVLSMHAPYEVIAKLDVYMAFKAFGAFYKR